ncbi:MAG: FAD-dependent oxidoreductase, partial [Hyphomicrobiales bacterium]
MGSFDIILIGRGNTGCEAAASAARMGAPTARLTHRVPTVGAMLCEMGIGGRGKGERLRALTAL